MLYPANFESKIGFDQVREMILEHCLCGLGRAEANVMAFSSDEEMILHALAETAEMKEILQYEDHFPSQDYFDMTAELNRIRIPGSYLEPETMSELKLSLETLIAIGRFFEKRSSRYPVLSLAAEDLVTSCRVPVAGGRQAATARQYQTTLPDLASGIALIIDDRSNIRSNASPELQRIRREMTYLTAKVEKKAAELFKTAKQSGWTPDDAELTLRNGRPVIPLRSAHKRKLTGFVQDESSTGLTVYVEPAELLELNNELRELAMAERREIVRILTEFADTLRPHIEELITYYHLLGHIDFLRSKALLAISINGTLPKPPNLQNPKTPNPQNPKPPKLQTSKTHSWHQATHPLLYLSLKKHNKPIVPLDIALDPDQRILIISGPNAGGKSICLKTVGLVQYMYQCGCLPPVREDSEFRIFGRLFIDIGDEQSLENDLSTYTSKLINLKYFLENLDDQSLFLVDEMGSGTDPSLGGAIAEAALEKMAATGAYGVITTHYSNLKLLPGKVQGVINGAMLYDTKKLKPLFTLKIGKPGSSFAMEIARNIGLPQDVIEKAEEKTGRSQLDFDRQLQDLEVERHAVTKRSTELHIADDLLNELIEKYTRLTGEVEKSKKEILAKAREEADDLLRNSNKLIEKTIKEIREAQAEKEKTKKAREEIARAKDKLSEGRMTKDEGRETKDEGRKTKNEFKEIITPNLQNPKTPNLQTQPSPPHQFISLDIRGFRADEAHSAVMRFIDDAIMYDLHEVYILHGKGNGVLRQVVRDYLRSVREVKKYHDEHVERGGAGITVVVL